MTATADANLFLYASDEASPFHDRAVRIVEGLAAGPDLFYLFWPVAIAYLRIATHPAIFDRPLTPDDAEANIDGLLERPHIRSPGEVTGFWDRYRDVTGETVVRGNLVPDAHVVALMRQHGVGEIWSHDRDFRQFEGIGVRDPFA